MYLTWWWLCQGGVRNPPPATRWDTITATIATVARACICGRSSAACDVTPTSPLRARCHWPRRHRPSGPRHRATDAARRSFPYMGQRRSSFIKQRAIRRPAPRCGQCARFQCTAAVSDTRAARAFSSTSRPALASRACA